GDIDAAVQVLENDIGGSAGIGQVPGTAGYDLATHEGHVGRGESQIVQDPHVVQGDACGCRRHLDEVTELLTDRRTVLDIRLRQRNRRLNRHTGRIPSRAKQYRAVSVRVIAGAGPCSAARAGAGDVCLIGDNSATGKIRVQGGIELDLDLRIGGS